MLRGCIYKRSHNATINNEKPINLFNISDDSGEVKKFLKKVPKPAHKATKGKQRIIEKIIKVIFAKMPVPKIVPKPNFADRTRGFRKPDFKSRTIYFY